jgi:class 3 adenylate cyclase
MSLAAVRRRALRSNADVLPSGTVTFLLTDVEASSAHWDADADATERRLDDLDRIVRSCVARNDGVVIKSRGEGDSAFAVFTRASSAIVAACEIQRALAAPSGLCVRAAVHTGEVRLRGGDYFGVVPNRAARLRSIAHGGQIVVSHVSAELAEPELDASISLVRLGSFRIRDWQRTTQVYGVRGPGLRTEFPPLRVLGDRDHAVMTIVVVDSVGATELVRGLTDPEVFGMQRELDRRFRNALTDHGGAFLKMMGDGCLAAFDDPSAAIEFTRSLVRASAPDVCCAITAGRVELVGDDVVGRAIYEAYKLERRAAPRQILLSRTVAELIAGTSIDVSMVGEDYAVEP